MEWWEENKFAVLFWVATMFMLIALGVIAWIALSGSMASYWWLAGLMLFTIIVCNPLAFRGLLG